MTGHQEDSLPSYLTMYQNKMIGPRIRKLYAILESCELCPRKCHVNRLRGELGVCKAGRELMVSSHHLHFGEEEPLVGRRRFSLSGIMGQTRGGSGTIFLTHCNLLCVYCQNYGISHLGSGDQVTPAIVARMMLSLQDQGCHNINFVTPTHYAPHLIDATHIAIENGLILPLVWNCSGYENMEIIKLLDGIIDIYMPDIKYSQREPAEKYSNAPDYFDRCKEALLEMHRQVGDLKLDANGIAYRGLLIRHLILPNNLAGSEQILRFIAHHLSTNSYVNIMFQYRPEGRAPVYQELNRRPTRHECSQVVESAVHLGLTRGLNI
ncbi:MAG: radical SAM protein [Candidatus Bathyarchaeota archaeon]|nr:radical SAM protein [Candidatus Bathyarchaeota archaeon]